MLYPTYQISLTDKTSVKVQKLGPNRDNLGEIRGKLRKTKLSKQEFINCREQAQNLKITDSKDTKLLGETLFDVLFDDALCVDFLNFYNEVTQKGERLRVELRIDEEKIPELAALPWEFMCLPERYHQGTRWLGTDPNLVFSRWRSQWNTVKPIRLQQDEKLRIALVVSNPVSDPADLLGIVHYETLEKALKKLVEENPDRIELLPTVTSADMNKIKEILREKPHIFHFIGHGRLENVQGQDVGQIALVNDTGGSDWVDADKFSNLFSQPSPAVVMLQACEGGQLSSSKGFVGVVSKVIEQNIAVVVAMQYEVSNSTASIFAKSFYENLAQGEPVDVAAQAGREQISFSSQYNTVDFATPVIFMRVDDGHLFDRFDPIQDQKNRLNDLKTKLENPTDPNTKSRLQEEIRIAQQKIQELENHQELQPRITPEDKEIPQGIIDAFLYGQIVLFLGPGINRKFYLELAEELVKNSQESISNVVGVPCQFCPYLPDKRPNTEESSCPVLKGMEAGDLIEQTLATACLNIRYLCQYRKQTHKNVFYKKLRDLIKAIQSNQTPNPIHEILAKLPALMRMNSYPNDRPGLPYPLILTTNYDNLLESAFKNAHEDYGLVYYIADGDNKGEYRHQGNPAPLTSNYPGLPILDPGNSDGQSCHPIILKLFGTFDKEFVITQDQLNYFAAFSQTKTLPDTLMKLLTGTDSEKFSILFLGYSATDPELELIINRLWKENKDLSGSYLVHQSKPGELEKNIWEKRGVELVLIDRPLEDFMASLEKGIEKAISQDRR